MEPQLPFTGMVREQRRLALALDKREPLLVLGPAGSGKTRLLRETIRGRSGALYVTWERSPRALLRGVARALIAARHAEFVSRAGVSGDLEAGAWLTRQTSLHLRGLIWNAIANSPLCLALDGADGAGFTAYRFLQRLYHARGAALIAAARGAARLGALQRLYWNPAQILTIAPLNEREAAQLFAAAADFFQLRGLGLEEFRVKALAGARGNPGKIIEMCRLAAQAQYVSGGRIKFGTLRIDAAMRLGK